MPKTDPSKQQQQQQQQNLGQRDEPVLKKISFGEIYFFSTSV